MTVVNARDIALNRYPELGVNIEFDPAVGLYYLVVVFGNPAGE